MNQGLPFDILPSTNEKYGPRPLDMVGFGLMDRCEAIVAEGLIYTLELRQCAQRAAVAVFVNGEPRYLCLIHHKVWQRYDTVRLIKR